MKKSIIVYVITFCLVALFSGTLHAKNVSYKDFKTAMQECINQVDTLAEFDAPILEEFLKKHQTGYHLYNQDAKKKKIQVPFPKKEAKKFAKNFKSQNLKFNKKIKLYQKKCKRVEAMIKAGIMLGED